jgi:four helix bundle protein
MQLYRFEKLRVYQDALSLVESIYKLANKLPTEERFALTNQLKRSSTSVVLNIAEGSGGQGDVEFKSYLRIARKSLYETVANLKIAERLFRLNIAEILTQCDLVGKELNGLIKSLSSLKTKD